LRYLSSRVHGKAGRIEGAKFWHGHVAAFVEFAIRSKEGRIGIANNIRNFASPVIERLSDQKSFAEYEGWWENAEHFIVAFFSTFLDHANLLVWNVRTSF
jgi:hypothetical protein